MIFPNKAIIFILFNFSAIALIYIFIHGWGRHPYAIAVYSIASYTLVAVCVRIPIIVRQVKAYLYANKYTKTYLIDKDLRMRISMYRGLLINFMFASFKLVLGFVYNSSWLFAIAGYNVILSLMRCIVIFRSQKKRLSEYEDRKCGLQSYYICGWLVMILNIAVSVIIFMVIVQKQTIQYHMIVTIGLATFTFYCFVMAVINMIKYRERKNPVYAAIKRIDMVKAIVSVFTLQVTMLTTFSEQSHAVDIERMNSMTGVAVVIAINTIGAMMLVGVKSDFRQLNKV